MLKLKTSKKHPRNIQEISKKAKETPKKQCFIVSSNTKLPVKSKRLKYKRYGCKND